MKKLDYEKLGLKVGIEFHQMLNTKRKLFCDCPPLIKRGEANYMFRRELRPTKSELGEVDPAALFEFKRGRVYVYQGYEDASCLVEMDEEPPHELSEEALEVAITIALMMGSNIVDEIYVMRKIVIDGSNTTGFQRTALVALGGAVKVNGKEIPIQTICLEEDAARLVEVKGREAIYKLDRLGIPLIEIATAPVITSPEEAELVASKIGQLLRITGKVKRGLGTIRQDLNISIRGGAKIEVKGVQKLELISKIVEYEVLRQYNLLKIRDELKRRGLKEEDIKEEFIDVSKVFSSTTSKLISKALSRGGAVLALKLPLFKGLLGREIQPGRRLGTEMADRARFWGGVSGIIHSDELPGYGIKEEEVEEIKRILKVGDLDAFVLVADQRERAIEGLKAVMTRAKEALKGVPEETRGPNPDGTTHFSRPRPGSARMYPETDIRPTRVTSKLIEKIKANLPEAPEQKYSKFIKVYGLSEELARKMISSYRLDLFEKLVKEFPRIPPSFIASVIENTLKGLRRDGVPIENLTDEHIEETFKALNDGLVAKEAVSEVLKFLAERPEASVKEALKALGLEAITEEELKKIVARVVRERLALIKERRERSLGPIMGEVMKEVRGKIDGKKVSEVVRSFIKEALEGDVPCR